MIKWFAYIVLVLIFAPCLLFANVKSGKFDPAYNKTIAAPPPGYNKVLSDTTTSKKQREQDEKNKVKEVAKAKKQAKPEKVDDSGVPVVPKPKQKRQRRPEGLERPPEIPRRNGN